MTVYVDGRRSYSPSERIRHNDEILTAILGPAKFADLRDKVAERWGLEVQALVINGNLVEAARNAAKIKRETTREIAEREFKR